jgi:hypothetical protein
MRARRSVTAAAIAIACARAAQAQPEPDAFALQAIPVAGRAVAAEIVELDGDGRAELLVIVIRGAWPDETREIRVHAPAVDGVIPEAPAWSAPVPDGAATYDVADLDAKPGQEILFLVRDGVRVLSRGDGTVRWRSILVPQPPTVAVRPDERGLDRLRLARLELGAGRLLIPGLDEAWVLGRQGESIARLHVGGRANYLVPPRPGLEIGESEIELYFDVPTLQTADLDGDGRSDVVATNRHALHLFRQRADASFPLEPDRVLPLRLIPLEDHVRNTGSVRSELRDLDGDGRADLLLSYASGGLLRAANRSRIHLNRDGGFDLTAPDQVFEREGGVAADELVDLDGDGRPEWLRVFLPLGLLEMAEVFVQREIDLEASILRPGDGGTFDPQPWLQRQISVSFDFETLRPRGFSATVGEDWNGDGYRDWLSSARGDAVEVWLGGPTRRFATPSSRQELATSGRLRSGDLDGDGLPDFVIYDPRKPDAPVRVGINRGRLPDTRPTLRSR